MTHLRLRGSAADLALALDRLHVHAVVVGVHEAGAWTAVQLGAPVPDGLDLGPVDIEELPAPDTDFVATGLQDDAVIEVCEGLLVRPPWVASPAGFVGIELVVPRAMAFGSGEHGSTQAALCLPADMLDDSIQSFADVGTGSGILALYARARGCEKICACDVDPVAVAAARELLPGARIIVGGPEDLCTTADAVVANMTGGEIQACRDALLALWSGRGPLVLSGLQGEEVDSLSGWLPLRAPDLRVDVDGYTALGWRRRVVVAG